MKKQTDTNNHQGQVLYLNRWVDEKLFRAFVYNTKGEEKLSNSYKEFEELTSSGIWFSSKESASQHASKERKPKNDTLRSDS